MIAEWSVPFELETPAGSLPINQAFWTTDDRRYQLVPAKCASVGPLRVTDDDIPQGDGGIPHRRWRGRYSIHLAIELFQTWNDGQDPEPACETTLVEMLDELGCHLNLMPRTGLIPGGPNARLFWTPTNLDERMLDGCQISSPPSPNALEGAMAFQVEVDIDSKHPYYIRVEQDITEITDGDTAIITNGGNADFYCVMQVDGPTTGFTITNYSVLDQDGNPLEVVYDDALPGAPSIGTDYVELNFFDGTAFLNGNEDNLLAGINLLETDFFPLVPECEAANANVIGIVGADVTVLSNWAWS